MAGSIMGEKSFAYPFLLSCGLFRVEMVCEFVVIVAVAEFSLNVAFVDFPDSTTIP